MSESIGVMEDRHWKRVNVDLTGYRSVPALLFEPGHTRILLWSPNKRPYWTPLCFVKAVPHHSGKGMMGEITSEEVIPSVWLNIVNAVAVDYDRREMAKCIDFVPVELPRGKSHKFQYHFYLRARRG